MSQSTAYPITPMASGALVDATANPDPMALDVATVVDAFHQHGAVLIDGLALEREAFPTFTERFVDTFIEYVGGADNDRGSALKGSNTVLQVTGGNTAKSAIPAHGEMFYTEPRPHTLFFACMRPADENGQTTIIDGIAVWNDLPADVQALFETQKLVYRRIYDTATWQQVYKTDSLDHVRSLCAETGVQLTEHEDGSIETVHSCHAYYDHAQGRAFVNSILTWAGREYLMGKDDSKVRFEDGSELSKDMLWAINDVCEKHTVNIPWKPGNVAMIDNFRVMHGRRAYEDTGRDIIMRMSRAQVAQPAG
ncbi:MAG: TauD/TfdA family dioxygenase [Roseovarius sp.]